MKRLDEFLRRAFSAVALCFAIGIGSAWVYAVWAWALTPACVYSFKGCE